MLYFIYFFTITKLNSKKAIKRLQWSTKLDWLEVMSRSID